MAGLEYRKAAAADVGALVDLRIDFMRIVKDSGLEDEAEWRTELGERFASELASGAFVSWLCLDSGQVVAASGLAFPSDLPMRASLGLEPGEALVLNMYTLPEYRRRGIAMELLLRSIAEARARGVRRLRLQPTDDGRAIYERAGFRARRRGDPPAEGHAEGRDMTLEL